MTEGLRSIRALSKDTLRGVKPATRIGDPPKIEWVDPSTLFVEESYQRGLGENGIAMIRKIIAEFNFASFKIPNCVCLRDTDNVLVVVDGQHTAIAAASHPNIGKIPVSIVTADSLKDRAAAFSGINRTRLSLTQMVMFHADVVAGIPEACKIKEACDAAGALVLHKPINLKRPAQVGATIAVGSLRRILRKHGQDYLTKVLRILVQAERGPIKAAEIEAVSSILNRFPDASEKLLPVVKSRTAEQWAAMGAMAAAESKIPLHEAIADWWFRGMGYRKSQVAKKPVAAAQQPKQIQIKETVVVTTVPEKKPEPIVPVSKASDPDVPIVEHNGVSIDRKNWSVSFKGKAVTIKDQKFLQLVLLLARVRPAFVEQDFLKTKMGYRTEASIDFVVGQFNDTLWTVGLSIRKVMKTGWMVADLSEK